MSNNELKALLQCALAGASRTALMSALTAALQAGLHPTSRDDATAAEMPLALVLRSVSSSSIHEFSRSILFCVWLCKRIQIPAVTVASDWSSSDSVPGELQSEGLLHKALSCCMCQGLNLGSEGPTFGMYSLVCNVG